MRRENIVFHVLYLQDATAEDEGEFDEDEEEEDEQKQE